MEEFKKIFDDYVEKLREKYKEDEMSLTAINTKYEHSLRVRDNMLEIVKRQKLNLDPFIVEFIGLFHDIGRFYQWDKYHSFNDKETKNHAKLSVIVLEDEGIIHKVDYEKRPYIMDAILMHNLKELPRLEDRKMYHYASVIRDADKLDGFRLTAEHSADPKESAHYKDKSFEAVIRDEVYNNILNKVTTDKYSLETVLECKVANLAYISTDINYNATLELIKENDYVNKMVEKMQDTPRTQEIKKFVEKYVEDRLNGKEEQ